MKEALRSAAEAPNVRRTDRGRDVVRTYRLETLADAVSVATTLTYSWFRGQSVAGGELLPRLFRRENWDPIRTTLLPDLELKTINDFKRHASLLTDLQLPRDSDRLGWLCVMQHYRCPTRLLDWTENLLVALYFAVAASPQKDGEVWAMLPWALNEAAGAGRGIPLPESPHVRFLLGLPYSNGTPDVFADSLKLPGPVQCPLALEVPFRFARMAAQASTFTIHPAPEGATSVVDALPDEKHLVRYLVPADVKDNLLNGLRSLGLSQRHLFPDLEGLSQMIEYDSRPVQYSPPSPPQCSGEG